MEIRKNQKNGVFTVCYGNNHDHVRYRAGAASKVDEGEIPLKFTISSSEVYSELKIPLSSDDHIIGLGGKALPVEKKRTQSTFWNTDVYGYRNGSDPLYLSIPFFYIVNRNGSTGVFIDYPGMIKMDFGVEKYDYINIRVISVDFDIYVITGNSLEEILRKYLDITGHPSGIPSWMFRHQVCRYSYSPQESAMNVLRKYIEVFGKDSVGAIYLDIDYMDGYRNFTVSRENFPDMKGFIMGCHEMGVKVIPLVNPGIKIDQNDETFLDGLGSYAETGNGEIYIGHSHAGASAYPDFLSEKGKEFWHRHIKKFLEYGFDGIWLDMSEPTVKNSKGTFDHDVMHRVKGEKIRHEKIHNLYALEQAEITKTAVGNDRVVLARSGYPGIQRYAVMWTGDGEAGYDNMALQIPLITSMGITGMPFVGCDLGGFLGKTTPDLLLKFYLMALFFPLYRNHKEKHESDGEPYTFPEPYVNKFRNIIKLRNAIIPHLLWKAACAVENLDAFLRPISFNYPGNDGYFSIDDEYMVGEEILVAPMLSKDLWERNIILPEGRWYCLEDGNIYGGESLIRYSGEMPFFLREGAVFLMEGKILFFGRFSGRIYIREKWVNMVYDGESVKEGFENMKGITVIDVEKERPKLHFLTG